VWEIIRSAGGLDVAMKMAGISDNAMSRFTRTANHQAASGDNARLAQAPPKNPVSIGEARAMIGRRGSQLRDIPHREVIDHRVPTGLDQDHPGQPNAPGRQALSQRAQRELDVPHLQVSEFDLTDQPGQVPGHDPVARHGDLCLRVQGHQTVLQALPDGVTGGCADSCGKFRMPGALVDRFLQVNDLT
jgi:hypothetical protein